MAHLHKKIKKGRPYYYLREIKRVDGKPKVVSQVYLGTVETIAAKFREADEASSPVRLRVEEFGALFLAHEMERQLDTIGLIDSMVPRLPKETGPSVGEYFFYAWANRLIDPRSKRALEEWYGRTAVQQIRPVEVKQLSSQRYWDKWDRVSASAVEQIARGFFEKVWSGQGKVPECVLFDTTNYYTFMASQTESELCQRGHNKECRHHLRQVGLSLVVDRQLRLPLHYAAYEGNLHDSKEFSRIMDEMFGVLCRFNETKQRLTVVFDKGMNSEENIAAIDDHARVHFITTYSPYFAEALAATDLKFFVPVETRSNLELEALRKPWERTTAYRTRHELWGKERTVVVTHNPSTLRKKTYTLERKLEQVREALIEFRSNYRAGLAQWKDPKVVRERYERLCERMHIASSYYDLEFGDLRKSPELSFRKNACQIEKAAACFGRNIIVTDNHDWSTDEIVQLSLDRAFVENQFRASKDDRHVGIEPIRHWTDSKIRCQLLTCVMALTVLRLIEMKIEGAGIKTPSGSSSGQAMLEELRTLHSVLAWHSGKREPRRHVETPTKTQAEVLKAFGWIVTDGGVLQAVNG